MSNKYYVYLHYTADTNRLFYVGKGKDGRAYANSKNKRTTHWHNIVNKHGFHTKFYARNISEELALDIERNLITLVGKESLCNLANGGKLQEGWNHSEDSKLKMSVSKKGMIGKPLTDSIKKKISNARKGIKFSQAHKDKLSFSLKGRKASNTKPVMCVETGNVYKSATLAGIEHGKPNGFKGISAVARGKQKSAFGFKWVYL